jgi:hypothetical protein
LGDDHPFGTSLGHDDLGRDRVRLVLQVQDRVLAQSPHAAEQELGVPPDEHGPAGNIGVEALDAPVIEGQHVVLRNLDEPKPL